ncbi:MAG: tail fiber domain-containing protein [Candidatus Competibacteraceae bacterium]
MKQQLFYATTCAALVALNLGAKADQIFNDEVLTWGVCASRAGACVNGESFFPDALTGSIAYKSKDNRTGIWFDDTDAGDADWIIFMDDLADVATDVPEAFHIFNDENDSIPLIIENGAGTNLLYLDSAERIGINTNTPSEDLEIASSSPTIALRDTDGPRTWEINSDSNSTLFDIADVTAGTSPFAIESETPTDTLYLDSSGNIGIGLDSPARQLHLRGPNAVFRMDRSEDSAAFLLVRTTPAGIPLKTFVLGTDASGSNNGTFVINDLGTAVSGGGSRRMTITNAGNVIFTGSVEAANLTMLSARRFKESVEQISEPLTVTQQLQGVRFVWKDSGRPSLGFIAEEVAPVLPEVVERDEENGQLRGVNYSAIVAVLVVAIKEHQRQIEQQQTELFSLRAQVAELISDQVKVAELQARWRNSKPSTPA